MRDLWEQVQPLVTRAARPARYINPEWGASHKEAGFNFCMAYPDTYELGQANQAVRILCNAVNAQEGMAAQRCFLPAVDMCDALREAGVSLFSLEGCHAVADFDAVGITLPHELCATNVCELLDLAGIPVLASQRAEADPIILGGGPCAFNPEPFALFFDAFNIGEGEEALPEQLRVIREMRQQGASRHEILLALAQVPGTYVPGLYEWLSPKEAAKFGQYAKPSCPEVPLTVTKRAYEGFARSNAWEPCIVPFAEVAHDRLSVEILRGCARGCRFCQAGMMYRPVRERSADNIVNAVKCGLATTGYDEVSLTSLSSTDHSQIEEILSRINWDCAGKGIRVSIPSQRLDSFGVKMAHLVAGQKKGGLTFAPEAGTQRLRDVINKNVTEDDLFNAVDAAFSAGWHRCKLYFMIGLPTETDEDIRGIASLAQRVLNRARAALPADQRKGGAQVSISCALFVPKAQTPFQWEGQISPEEARRRISVLRHSITTRAIDVHWHDPATSSIEAVMSRGGREISRWVHEAWTQGARFDAWTELFNPQAWESATESLGIDRESIAQASHDVDEVLPWDHISSGVSRAYLAHERKIAYEGKTTPDCTFGDCTGCGACMTTGIGNCIERGRHE